VGSGRLRVAGGHRVDSGWAPSGAVPDEFRVGSGRLRVDSGWAQNGSG
jgi:hypothetical protein